jgi:RNA polymerase-binding transcription factor
MLHGHWEATMTGTERITTLKHMLTEHRRELGGEVETRIRDSRSAQPRDVRDLGEASHAEHGGDVGLLLLQMQADTLRRIDEALLRLEAGKYGTCIACAREIAAPRLRALPFAVRCTACEGKREHLGDRARQLARTGPFALAADSLSA